MTFIAALVPGPASQATVADAIRAGTPLIDLRLRYENVDQENGRETHQPRRPCSDNGPSRCSI